MNSMHIEIEKLESIPFIRQLSFAYLSCERLYSNYKYFSHNFQFGDVLVLRRAIDHIRQSIIGDCTLTAVEIQQDFYDVSINTPDTENFTTVHVSFALDACCVILGSLQFLLDRNFDHIIYISRYGTDTVDRYITSNMDVDFFTVELEQSISNDQRMKNEIILQNEIISFLALNRSLEELDLDLILNRIMSRNSTGSL